jgi:hypothetical protein
MNAVTPLAMHRISLISLVIVCISHVALAQATGQSQARSAANAQTGWAPAPIRLFPQDESSAAPAFGVFIERFRKAVAARDPGSLLSMVHPDIVSEPFGDALHGRASFRSYHGLDDPKSTFWATIAELLQGAAAVDGCSNPDEQCRVAYPYWSTRLPDDLDALEHFVVRTQDAAVYRTPRRGAAVIARVSYEVVRRPDALSQEPEEGWEEVVLWDGRRGFLREQDLHRPIGYRMTFIRREDGTWVLGNYVAGD